MFRKQQVPALAEADALRGKAKLAATIWPALFLKLLYSLRREFMASREWCCAHTAR